MGAELVNLYREFDARCAREVDRLSSRREFEGSLFVPSEASKREARLRLERLLTEAASLHAPDDVFSLLKSHFTEFLMARLSDLETTFSRPGRFVGGLTDYVDFLGRQDSRSSEERALLLTCRARQADEMWSGLASLISSYGVEALKGLVEACSKLGGVADQAKKNADREYAGLPEPLRRQMDAALDYLGQRSVEWGEVASRALGAASGSPAATGMAQGSHTSHASGKSKAGEPSTTAQAPENERTVDPDAYRVVLRDELGVDLDELLSWHEDEVRSTREEVFQALSRINLGATPVPKDMLGVVEILNRFAGPCDTPDEMFQRMRSYLDRAQAAARNFVRLPEESVRVVPTPYQYRDSYPWGGYGGGCPKRRPLIGEVFLNDGNFRAITDGWIKINAVHECYPGHHVQWVRATLDPLPETIKMGARGVPLLEGACVRTERLMEPVFPEDPFYPLFVAYRRHHTATRIKADLYLQYFGRPVEDVVDLYMEEMGFDRDTARGQVKAQELMMGYFNCYYYGLKRLSVLQAQHGLSDKDFTETIFGLPHVSLSTLEKFLRLDDAGKERVLTGFPSLLPA